MKNPEKYKDRDKEKYQKGKDRISKRKKDKYKENPEPAKQRAKNYRKNNPEKKKIADAVYKEKNREKRKPLNNQYMINRRRSDEQFRLIGVCRCRIYKALIEQDVEKQMPTKELIGCSVTDLKKHIESKFKDGMGWENYGLSGWHIDHIKPLSLFDLSDPVELLKACHFTNLQPLWAKENLSKGNRYDG